MSNYELLGRDETKSAGLFVRWVFPTDFDRILQNFNQGLIDSGNGKYTGFTGGKSEQFLRDYMRSAGEQKKSISDTGGFAYIISDMQKNYDYPSDALFAYMNTLNSLGKQGVIPESVLRPYDYEPTSIMDDIGKVSSDVVKKATLPLGIIAVIAVGAYAFMSGGFAHAPKLLSKGS